MEAEVAENRGGPMNDIDDTPRSSDIMIHTVPEITKARWNHIQDLDSFFTKMYQYHQKHGFFVIILNEVCQLLEFAFVVWILTLTMHCIRYDVLFGETEMSIGGHTTLADVILSREECVDQFGGLTYFILITSAIYFLMRTIKVFYNITQFLDIKKFYNAALNIDDNDLDNITWHDIKKKVRTVQTEQHMCIDKDHLTDLDIYHRILRFKNYMVALMNKNLLPVRFHVPLYGEVVTLSRGLLFNIDLILFRSPGSPFQNNWQLRDDYTVRGNQVELAKRLSKLIFWVAIANIILAPAIFVWQILYFSFTYANILRKEPGALGMRTWSNYGRLYLRHFNELDHELDARLNRAYEYSDRYLKSFSSPFVTVIARFVLFISGGFFLVLFALGIYDEHVFQVKHMLTLLTALTAIGLICRNLIPDDNVIWCPEQLMTAILAHVHYLPSTWKNKAHTLSVQKEFSHLFQFKAIYFLNEILSPLVTPFLLLFVFRPKALEIVKFFRSFTVSVRGVGNVCSFAQMDVRKFGNPDWQLADDNIVINTPPPHPPPPTNTNDESEKIATKIDTQRWPLENGKTELSLIRFTLTNPDWQMPETASKFVNDIRQHALADLHKVRAHCQEKNPLTESLVSFGSIGNEYSSVVRSLLDGQGQDRTMKCNDNTSASCMRCSDIQMKNENPITTETSNNARGDGNDNFDQMLQQNLGDMSFCIENQYGRPMRVLMNNSNTIIGKTSFGGGAGSSKKLRVSKLEGCVEGPQKSLLNSLYGQDRMWEYRPSDLTIADMCLNTLYLHEINSQKRAFTNEMDLMNADKVEKGSSQGYQRNYNTVVGSIRTTTNAPLHTTTADEIHMPLETTPLLRPSL